MTTHGSRKPAPRGTTLMTVNGLSCTLHMPKATASRFDERGKEITSRLAPSAPVTVYAVDDFPACPREWEGSDIKNGVACYFFKAEPGHMVWLDLNGNGHNAHHVAAIIAAQGLNAISGRKTENPARLEQYLTDCPVHGTRFEANKYCRSCGYEWPAQNYLATTTTPYGRFWRDGFRGADGKTREFLFTEEVERGVAANIIGDARIDAFGVALFTSKEPKPEPVYRGATRGGPVLESLGPQTLGGARRGMRSAAPKGLEVGAGALVHQNVDPDDRRLDYWNDAPAGVIRIFYADADLFAEIVGSGVGGTGGSEGFLGGIPVGNK